MKLNTWISFITLVILLLAHYNEGGSKIISNGGIHRIEDEFVIVLKSIPKDDNFDWSLFKEKLIKQASLVVKHVISFGDFKAAMVKADRQQLELILDDADIHFIEMNQKIRHFHNTYQEITIEKEDIENINSSYCLVQRTGTDIWGLSRLNQRDRLNDNPRPSYSWGNNENGTGVNAYVMDSGIYVEHSDFQGRAVHGFTSSSIKEREDDNDNHGHGTHVAGKIGGNIFGVAKGVNLIAVKVLAGNGEGTVVDLLQGLQYIYNDHTTKQTSARTSMKSVVNLSLGAEGSAPVMEQAIALLIEEGITMVVASGNEYRDACEFTPSKITAAITVGSTTIDDKMSPFSNYGPCVDILAPGSNILSTWNDNPTSFEYASGTSMAAPHVTGVVARYLSQWKDSNYFPSPFDVEQHLLDTANAGKIYLDVGYVGEIVKESTPNKLLNGRCGSDLYSSASHISSKRQHIWLYCLAVIIWKLKH